MNPMNITVDRDFKLEFLNYLKANAHDIWDDKRIYIASNFDNDENEWFYIQLGSNDCGDCFHLELGADKVLCFHIEKYDVLSKRQCIAAFNDLKNESAFADFEPDNEWNEWIDGMGMEYKHDIKTKEELFDLMIKIFSNTNDLLSKYKFHQ